MRMHETAASTLTRGLDHAKGASPSPPRLDRRQLSTPDELGGARSRNEGGKTAMHQTDSPAGSVRRHGAGAGAGYSVGLGGHREQEVGESPTGSRRRHGGGAGAGGGYTVGVVGPPMLQPARLTPAEQRSPHTWMVRKEMRGNAALRACDGVSGTDRARGRHGRADPCARRASRERAGTVLLSNVPPAVYPMIYATVSPNLSPFKAPIVPPAVPPKGDALSGADMRCAA